jgi:hypothetical protein
MAENIGTRPLLAIIVGFLLAGCVNFSALDDLKTATPTGSPFDQALFKNYAFLAKSFGEVGQASYTSFDQDASIPLAKTDAGVAALANTFAAKALQLSRGEVVDPVSSVDISTHVLRDRLVRALTPGRDVFPRDAARAQTDWDCWHLNAAVPSQAAAAEQCRRSFDVTLARLEAETKAAEAAAAAAAAAQKPAPGAAEASSSTDSSETP